MRAHSINFWSLKNSFSAAAHRSCVQHTFKVNMAVKTRVFPFSLFHLLSVSEFAIPLLADNSRLQALRDLIAK